MYRFSLSAVARACQLRYLALALAMLPSATLAQDEAGAAKDDQAYVETFDSGDPAVMLGGQIGLQSDSAPWILHVSDGNLVMENRTEAQSVHYSDIAWVKYPDSDALDSTDGAEMSAVVMAKNDGIGGVGILAGSGTYGAYLAFLVDDQGQYHVMRKDGNDVRRLNSGKVAAIREGKPNTIALKWRGDTIVFFANAVEVIRIPYELAPGRDVGGLGLVSFGIGTFSFDSVEITRSE